jgi:formyl-CoA transferase
MTSQEAYQRLVEFDVPAAPILTQRQILVDPQYAHNGTIVEATHPVYGRYRRVRAAARFSETIPETTTAAALYGENTDEILEELGLDEAQRAQLRERDVIA